MSCYNAERYLSEAIESILSQTLKDFELILIDDGSTDNSLELVRRYAAEDDRIVVIEKENTGLADSLNQGIKAARGEWIARLDADDVALPCRLKEQIRFVQKHPEHVVVGSGCIVIDQEGKEIRRYRYPSGTRLFVSQLERGRSSFPHSTAFFRTTAVRDIFGYRPRIYRAQDKDLWLRLSALGEIGCLPEYLIKLRKHSDSITAKDEKCAISSYAAMISFLLVQKGHADPIEQSEEVYRSFLKWLEKRLIETGYFENSRAMEALREIWNLSIGQPLFAKILRLLKEIIRSPYSVNIVKRKLLGSDLAIKLAKEWQK